MTARCPGELCPLRARCALCRPQPEPAEPLADQAGSGVKASEA